MSHNSQWIEINTITPWEKNPRYNEHAVQQVAVSIQQFGFLNPIIAQKSTKKIICGHTRYKAAKQLNLLKVPVIFADLDDVQSSAYAIADNKLGEIASWNEGLLAEILSEIKSEIDLESLGYNQHELNALLSNEDLSDIFNIDEENAGIIDNEFLTINVKVPQYIFPEVKSQIEDALSSFEDVENR
jgi:ParB-like chromosome segregation protein Spo0J